eukprot:4581624-Amphidinium_carterae.2
MLLFAQLGVKTVHIVLLDVVKFLVTAAERFLRLTGMEIYPGGSEFEKCLAGIKVDHSGEVIGVRRRIISGWPSLGSVAVVKVADVLVTAARERMLEPELSLLPQLEGPASPRVSRCMRVKMSGTRLCMLPLSV